MMELTGVFRNELHSDDIRRLLSVFNSSSILPKPENKDENTLKGNKYTYFLNAFFVV
jgi:hypothetical protein